MAIILNEPKNWQNSPYPFKSPHRVSKFRVGTFNFLNEKAGDGRRIDRYSGKRDIKNNVEIADDIVSRLNNFSSLRNFSSLSEVEQAISLRDVFLLPAKQGIVIYSVYSILLSDEKIKPASYEKMHKYLNIKYRGDGEDENNKKGNLLTKIELLNFDPREDYIITNLLRDAFKLYTLAKPFRVLLGLPLGTHRYSTSKHKKMVKTQNFLIDNIDFMEEWKKVSSPGLILSTVYEVARDYGYYMALQFVRYLFRASSKIRYLLTSKKPKKIDLEKIRSLTQRYLSIETLKEKYKDYHPSPIQKSEVPKSR